GDRAAQHGITIGLEVVNRYETNVLNTAAQAVAFAKRVALPNVKVHLDTYHMNIEEADLESALIDTGAMLGYFHIGESGRGYLGSLPRRQAVRHRTARRGRARPHRRTALGRARRRQPALPACRRRRSAAHARVSGARRELGNVRSGVERSGRRTACRWLQR